MDPNKAKERAKVGVSYVLFPNVDRSEKLPDTGRYMSGSPEKESLDRNLLTLVKRSLRKAFYLQELKAFYATESTDAQDLITYLQAPQRKDAHLVGLVPGVRMEAYDPVHRPFEFRFDANGKVVDPKEGAHGLNQAFYEWFNGLQGGPGLPFFLWLEKHRICRL